ncbi:hypothetical protein CFHF_07370 [Caulobacter flavus]|uniref:DUF3885 domain-containing protein n=1 Tax=Caulobacter flavus TaxID=1679497 RepID=A0A2N5CWD9_9CAUL|nr:hypothetical protein [Caulobacter flavus]AYV44865.1 hypothetical protein C1707_00515 [Caulobacter flavus]PLR18129.1 hypothetical protein CFHF_07370 [Caulobacter flavus]
MNQFQDLWARFHEGHRPIGYRLRQGGAANWVRFHSLPESKRYAETDEERGIILRRQNALAAELFASDPCWLVQTHWTTPDGVIDVADQNDPFAATRQFNLEPAFAYVDDEDEDDEDPSSWRVHAGVTRWTDRVFDELLADIAEDRAGFTLWMSEATGSVFAPYDGGVDLFLAEAEQVAALKAKYRQWLSSHASGL